MKMIKKPKNLKEQTEEFRKMCLSKDEHFGIYRATEAFEDLIRTRIEKLEEKHTKLFTFEEHDKAYTDKEFKEVQITQKCILFAIDVLNGLLEDE